MALVGSLAASKLLGKKLISRIRRKTMRRAAKRSSAGKPGRKALTIAALLFLPVFVLVLPIALMIFFLSFVLGGFANPQPSTAASQDIPPHVLQLYRTAADTECPTNTITWPWIAAIGAVESGHGTFAGHNDKPRLAPNGTAMTGPRLVDDVTYTILNAELGHPDPIYGIELHDDPAVDQDNADGDNDTTTGTDDPWRTIPIGPYAGQYGLAPDGSYARALGPMQFLPSTFDGIYPTIKLQNKMPDPHNMRIAVHATAAKLCADAAAGINAAIFAYNQSGQYLTAVRYHAQLYTSTDLPPATTFPRRATPDTVPDDQIDLILDSTLFTIANPDGVSNLRAYQVNPSVIHSIVASLDAWAITAEVHLDHYLIKAIAPADASPVIVTQTNQAVHDYISHIQDLDHPDAEPFICAPFLDELTLCPQSIEVVFPPP